MKKTKKMAKAIVAMMLVMIMMFGVVPPMQSQAAPIRLDGGKGIDNAVMIPAYGKQYYGVMPSWDNNGDWLWYKFKTKDSNAFYTLDYKVTSADKIGFTIYDITDEIIADSGCLYSNNSGSFNLKLKKNTVYYLKVHVYNYYGVGKFTFSLSWRKDLEPDTRKTATKIVQNKTYTCKIDGTKSNDSDWFRFVPATTGKYTITVRNVSAKRIRFMMQNEAGKTVDVNDGIKNSKLYTVVIGKSDKVTLQKGKAYYFRIAGTTSVGQYKIRVTKR